MKKIICFFALLGCVSTSVHAATFNFGDYADGVNTNGATFPISLANDGLGEFGYESYSVTNDGVTVTATGSYIDSSGMTQDAFAYMDGKWRNRAGLGVCKTLNSESQCAPSSDDNITANEALKLVFNTTVSLDGLGLVNGEHYSGPTDFIGDFQILVDNAQLYTLSLAKFPLISNLVGHTFEFISLADPDNKNNKTEFYINTLEVSTVPLPAAAWLFGSALLGFFGISRRKKIT